MRDASTRCPPTHSSKLTFRFPTGGVTSSVRPDGSGPIPVAQMLVQVLSLNAFVMVLTFHVTLSVITPGPLPAWLRLKMPGPLAITLIGTLTERPL